MRLPPPAVNDIEGTTINTRQIMCLPARYIPLMLSSVGYTIKEVWETLYPAIVEADDLQDCQPLMNWVRAATTRVVQANQPGILGYLAVSLELTAPIADEDLTKHRLTLLHQALPAVFKPKTSYEAAIAQMAVSVTEHTNDNRMAREQKAADAATPKNPSDKFGIMLPLLLEYLEVADERNLPELWQQLANCTKRQEYHVILEQVQAQRDFPSGILLLIS